MTSFFAASYINDSSLTQSQFKTAIEQMRSIMYEMPGGGPQQAVTIASYAITPSNNWGPNLVVDTESAAANDDLKTITATNCRDGHVLYIRSTDNARVVRVYTAGGGAGQIITQDGAHVSLTNTKQWIALKYNLAITSWEEVARSQNIDCFPIAGSTAYHVMARGSGTGKASMQALSLGHLNTLMDTTLGWTAKGSALVPSSNTITPTQAFHEIDASAAREIRSIAQTNMTDGRFLILQPSSSANTITLKHNYGGATNPLTLRGSADCVLSTLDDGIMLMRQSSGWKEIARFGSSSSSGAIAGICQGRLTLTSGSPVTGNVTAAGTLYFTPYNGNQVATYSGSAWTLNTFTEKSISVATCKKYVNYDVFLVDSTLALELVEWKSITATNAESAGSSVVIECSDTSGVAVGQLITVATAADHSTVEECEVTAFSTNASITVRTLANSYGAAPKVYIPARATALTTQDGVYVKSGATTRLYLGTISAQAGNGTTGGTIDDSRVAYNGVWNNFNRLPVVSAAKTTTSSYTYNSSTIREAEGSGVYGTSRIGFVVGLSEDDVKISNAVTLVPGSGNASYGYIGFDSVATIASSSTIATFAQTVGNLSGMFAEYATRPAIGRHAAIRLEQCTNSGGASTFYGNSATVSVGSTGMYMEHRR